MNRSAPSALDDPRLMKEDRSERLGDPARRPSRHDGIRTSTRNLIGAIRPARRTGHIPKTAPATGDLSRGQPATDEPHIHPGIRPIAPPTFRASPTSSANPPGLWLMKARLSSAAAPTAHPAASSCLEITDGSASITACPIVRRNSDDAQSGRSPRRGRRRKTEEPYPPRAAQRPLCAERQSANATPRC